MVNRGIVSRIIKEMNRMMYQRVSGARGLFWVDRAEKVALRV